MQIEYTNVYDPGMDTCCHQDNVGDTVVFTFLRTRFPRSYTIKATVAIWHIKPKVKK